MRHKQPATTQTPAVFQHTADKKAAISPVDKLTASDVAVNVAKATALYETTQVAQQAQSAKVAVLMSTSDTAIAAKPQVIDTPLKSWRDIKGYVVQQGDSVTSVAQKFGVTSDSVRWSNNITGDALTPGAQLFIPPSEGIAYTVAAGDTPESLATKFRATAERISADNDAELSPLVVGRRIFIANGQIAAPVSSTPATRASSSLSGGTVGGSFTPSYSANGYPWGWCTWYAAARSGAPSNWGNANTWAYYARLSGWRVSSVPTPGAIFQTPAGWAGHVGVVDAVSDDGREIKFSDMNGPAGFGRIFHSDWVPASMYPNYISR